MGIRSSHIHNCLCLNILKLTNQRLASAVSNWKVNTYIFAYHLVTGFSATERLLALQVELAIRKVGVPIFMLNE